MNKYLLGLAEVPASWPQAALRAQAVAARTFAVQRAGALLPTVAHQNYDGYDHEAQRPGSGIPVARRGVGDQRPDHRRRCEPADRCLLLVVDGRVDRGQRLLVGRLARVVPPAGQRQPLGPGVGQPGDVAFVDAGLHPAPGRAGARLRQGHAVSSSFLRGDPRRAAGVRVIGRRGGQAGHGLAGGIRRAQRTRACSRRGSSSRTTRSPRIRGFRGTGGLLAPSSRNPRCTETSDELRPGRRTPAGASRSSPSPPRPGWGAR